jgi:hypothetical protein
MTWGTYNDSAPAGGGDINTRLHICTRLFLQPYGAAVATNASTVDETLPVDGSAVTIACDNSQTGQWIAYGDAFA